MPTGYAADAVQNEEPRCSTCHRKSETLVCAACVARAANQHLELPSLLDLLAYEAVNGGGGIGEWVSGGSFGSRAPVDLQAVALTAVTPEAIGMALAAPCPPFPGASLPLWIVSWAAVWRRRFNHYTSEGVRLPRASAPVPAVDPPEPGWMRRLGPWMRPVAWDELPAAPEPVATMGRLVPVEPSPEAAECQAERQRRTLYRARVELGLEVARRHRTGAKNPADPNAWTPVHHPEDDPVAAHWTARYGPPQRVHRIVADNAYLSTWLEPAMAQFDDADEYILGLRALVAACRAAVGQRSDVVRLGRCPEPFVDRATGLEEPCGATLARDPMVSVVICPRCRHETNERGLLALALRMRAVWGETSIGGNA
jgi:hypothetical protein